MLRAIALATRTALLLAIALPAYAQKGDPPIVREAREWMDRYAQDLVAGNRAGVSGRYDRGGMYRAGNGAKLYAPYDSVVKMYAGPAWQPPLSFTWKDLTFEPLGNDAVVIVGIGLWEYDKAKPPIAISYTSLLKRQDGVLRIRVENESTGGPPAGAK